MFELKNNTNNSSIKTMNSLHFFYIIILSTTLIGASCTRSSPKNKKSFLTDYNKVITAASTLKRGHKDSDWEQLDRKFRIMLKEFEPTFRGQMSKKETLLFWENALGYVYVRYGLELLKRYAQTDETIMRIKGEILKHEIKLSPTIKRLCKEWPVLYGIDDSTISSALKKTFQLPKKKRLLPSPTEESAN